MDFQQEMEIYLRSRFTLIWVVSYEEDRLVNSLKTLCERSHRRLLTWDLAACFKPIANCSGTAPDARDPKTALEAIAKAEREQDTVFVLTDVHHFDGVGQNR